MLTIDQFSPEFHIRIFMLIDSERKKTTFPNEWNYQSGLRFNNNNSVFSRMLDQFANELEVLPQMEQITYIENLSDNTLIPEIRTALLDAAECDSHYTEKCRQQAGEDEVIAQKERDLDQEWRNNFNSMFL